MSTVQEYDAGTVDQNHGTKEGIVAKTKKKAKSLSKSLKHKLHLDKGEKHDATDLTSSGTSDSDSDSESLLKDKEHSKISTINPTPQDTVYPVEDKNVEITGTKPSVESPFEKSKDRVFDKTEGVKDPGLSQFAQKHENREKSFPKTSDSTLVGVGGGDVGLPAHPNQAKGFNSVDDTKGLTQPESKPDDEAPVYDFHKDNSVPAPFEVVHGKEEGNLPTLSDTSPAPKTLVEKSIDSLEGVKNATVSYLGLGTKSEKPTVASNVGEHQDRSLPATHAGEYDSKSEHEKTMYQRAVDSAVAVKDATAASLGLGGGKKQEVSADETPDSEHVGVSGDTISSNLNVGSEAVHPTGETHGVEPKDNSERSTGILGYVDYALGRNKPTQVS